MNQRSAKRSNKGNCHCYILRGKPVAIAKSLRPNTRYCGDDGKIQRISHRIDLENQHEGKPLFTGPIKLSVTFHIMATGKSKERESLMKTPSIVSMLKYVEEILLGIVYSRQDCIVKIDSEKVLDTETYTQIILEKI